MRLAEPIAVAAATVWLPPERETCEAAVAAGRVDAGVAEREGIVELPISRDLHAAEMAVEAAQDALTRADWPADTLDLLLHAWVHHQGLDFWSPPHYVARGVGASAALPIGVQQMCNGGAAALELAVARMLADPQTRRVLVTTSDRFSAPTFDRWRSDSGIVYGDGATALLLGDTRGDLLLRSIATVAAPQLEAMHRGDEPFASTSANGGPLDIRRRKKAFLAGHGVEHFGRIAAASVRDAIDRALCDAGIGAADVRVVMPPRLGRGYLDALYRPAFSAFADAELLELGARTGHLGAGDLPANIAHLATRAPLASGDSALLLSAGGGFTWTGAVLSRR